jgi:trk system potassium uptake protein
MRRIGIIGAGRFGTELVRSLAAHGADTLIIDSNREVVKELAQFVTKAVEGDAANPRSLEQAGFKNCDSVVIAIGTNLESSIMATANCKELEIKHLVARANSDMHGKILYRMGADTVIYPNRDRAQRLAHTLLARESIDLYAIAEGFNIAEINVPKGLLNKSLAQSAIRNRFGVTVLCIKRTIDDPTKPQNVFVPDADEVMQPDDKLFVFGTDKQIDAIIKE